MIEILELVSKGKKVLIGRTNFSGQMVNKLCKIKINIPIYFRMQCLVPIQPYYMPIIGHSSLPFANFKNLPS